MFETCYELREAFAKLFERPNQLLLTTSEMFPASRSLGEEVEATEMTGVEHLGQYVYEMTKTKLESLKGQGAALPAVEQTPEMMKVSGEEDEGMIEDEEEADEVT